MFHLVVIEGAATQQRIACDRARFLEYTPDKLRDRFFDLTDPEFIEMPAIFMGEGFGDEVARIGTILKVSQVAREIQIFYQIDPSLPALTNADLYDLKDQLQIQDFEFSRNHWAVKDVDLFEVLFRRGVVPAMAPTVFQLSTKPVQSNLVSVMMPFDASANDVYRSLKSSLETNGFRCQRADDMWENAHIMHDVIELICTAKVVICDLSGKNPNVFYEAGIAHTLGKDVILVTQSMNDVPFDLRPLRCVTYLDNNEGRAALAEKVLARVIALTT